MVAKVKRVTKLKCVAGAGLSRPAIQYCDNITM
jgi:hypothetical protein